MRRTTHLFPWSAHLVTACVAVLCWIAPGFASEAHWGYSGEGGPGHWGDLKPEFVACKTGVNQSPVDLKNFIEADLPQLQLQNYPPKATEIVNNGHTIQINVAPGSMLQVDGHAFELKQFHFHAPSENLIEGKSFPLEAHFVHKNEQGQLAVIAVLYASGQDNPVLGEAWKQMPAEKDKKIAWSAELGGGLLPASTAYYRFNGSLTTPPCSEGVRWLVLTEPVTVSAGQVHAFEKIMGEPNNRPVQPINARLILK